MGVDRTTHLVYGWKLTEPIIDPNGQEVNVYEDNFLPYVEGHKGIEETLVHDQMMGKYSVFGTSLGYLNEDHEGEFQTIDLSKIHPEYIRAKFKQVFGFDAPEEPKVLFFIHCS